MTTAKKVAKNIGAVTVGRLLTAFITLIINAILARYLSIEHFGIYNFTISYITLLLIFTNIGIPKLLTRNISRNIKDAENLLGSAVTLTFLIATIVTVLSIGLINLLGYSELTILAVTIYSIAIIFATLEEILKVSLISNLKMIYYSVSLLIRRFVTLSLITILVFLQAGVIEIVAATLISIIIGSAFLLYFSTKFIKIRPNINTTVWKNLLKESWPFALTIVFTIIHFRLDLFMISLLSSQESVGLYSSAFRLCEGLLILIGALNVSLFPIISRNFIDNTKIIKLFNLAINGSLILTIPLAVGVTMLSKEILNLIYGNSYIVASDSLSILIWSLVFIYINSIFATFLNATNKEKIVIKTTIGSIAVNIILNFFYIEKLGYLGASITTLLTVVYMFFVLGYYAKKEIDFKIKKTRLLKILISTGIMSIFMHSFNLHIIILIPSAIIIYFTSLIIMKGIEQEEIEILRKSIGIETTS